MRRAKKRNKLIPPSHLHISQITKAILSNYVWFFQVSTFSGGEGGAAARNSQSYETDFTHVNSASSLTLTSILHENIYVACVGGLSA